MDIRIASDNAVMIYFGRNPSPAVTRAIQRAAAAIETGLGPALVDLTPSYTSLLVVYNPTLISYRALRRALPDWCRQDDGREIAKPRHLTLPAYYAPEAGADLESLAGTLQLTTAEIIALHSNREYRVCAIGFAPGFAYLGDVDERIAVPRLATPRLKVPAGSIAIADRQTAVYPDTSPGGWNLIGRCPARFFDLEDDHPCTLAVGDIVIFKAISRAEFFDLRGEL